jgi:probable rRNA maturation factor
VPSNPILFHSEFPGFKLPRPVALRKWIEETIHAEKKEPGELNFIFCDDEYLLDMNQRFLGHDFYTDVITFDNTVKKCISGEIYISVDRVKENAVQQKEPFERELKRVMIHGVLHLLGYSDKGKVQKQNMRKKEDKYLSLL